MSKDIKQFLREQLKKEEIATMEEVAKNKELQDVTVPEELDASLFAQIDAYEKEKAAKKESRFTAEEEELMRLGRVYKRRKKYTKYWILAAVLVLAFAVGTTSIGGPSKVLRTIVNALSGGTTRVESDSDDGTIERLSGISEDDAYQQVQEAWNLTPVKLQYLPTSVGFSKFGLDKNTKVAQWEYRENNKVKIIYQAFLKYQTSSSSKGIIDKELSSFEKKVCGVKVSAKEYQVEGMQETRWFIEFKHQEVQYFMWIMDEKQEEVEKIVENLYFL